MFEESLVEIHTINRNFNDFAILIGSLGLHYLSGLLRQSLNNFTLIRMTWNLDWMENWIVWHNVQYKQIPTIIMLDKFNIVISIGFWLHPAYGLYGETKSEFERNQQLAFIHSCAQTHKKTKCQLIFRSSIIFLAFSCQYGPQST